MYKMWMTQPGIKQLLKLLVLLADTNIDMLILNIFLVKQERNCLNPKKGELKV